MVNKANMIEKTANLVNEKKIEGISDIRDESDKDGLRIVYDIKKDAIPNIVLNNLISRLSCSHHLESIMWLLSKEGPIP